MKQIKFVLNGCDISFVAVAPADITLEQLLKQTDKIHPLWCACGVCSLNGRESGFNLEKETEPEAEIIIDYDSIKRANPYVDCVIDGEEIEYDEEGNYKNS